MADSRCPDMYAVNILKVRYDANADGGAYWHNLANMTEHPCAAAMQPFA